MAEAAALYRQLLGVLPALANGHYNRGNACKALRPDHAQALNNCSNTLKELNRLEDALAGFERFTKPSVASHKWIPACAGMTADRAVVDGSR